MPDARHTFPARLPRRSWRKLTSCWPKRRNWRCWKSWPPKSDRRGHLFSAACLFGVAHFEILQRGERFLRHVPLAQDFVNHSRRESRSDQPPHHARRFFLIRRFPYPFALQVLPRQRLFARLAVARLNRSLNHIGLDALLPQIVAHAPRAQLVVLLAQPRIGLCIGHIVEIPVLLQPLHHCRNRRLPRRSRRNLRRHQPPQLGLGPHVPAQRLHGVVIQRRLVEQRLFLRTAAKRHSDQSKGMSRLKVRFRRQR